MPVRVRAAPTNLRHLPHRGRRRHTILVEQRRENSPRKTDTPTTRSHTAISHTEQRLSSNHFDLQSVHTASLFEAETPHCLLIVAGAEQTLRAPELGLTSQERYHQAAAHFRGFAKTRILQNAELVRKGNSWTFTPKGETGDAPCDRTAIKLSGSVALAKNANRQ